MSDPGRWYVHAPETVRVFGGGDRNRFDLTRDGRYGRRSSLCFKSRDDVEMAVDNLGEAIARLAVASADWTDRIKSERLAAVARVIWRGRALLEAIAPDPADRAKLRAIVDDARLVEINAELHIPWEWLYLGDDMDDPSPQQFLGASRVVGYNLGVTAPSETETERGTWDRFARLTEEVEEFHINLAEDGRLRSAACGTELRSITALGYGVKRLRSLEYRKQGELKAFGVFMKEKHQLAHFNTHANSTRGTKTTLTVSNDFRVSPYDIHTLRPFYRDAVVVLNCCNGLALHYGPDETLAAAFYRNGAEAIIATTSQIEDAYATRFIEIFYAKFIGGACIGDALIAARERMLTETGNPACLAYGLIGPFVKALPLRAAA